MLFEYPSVLSRFCCKRRKLRLWVPGKVSSESGLTVLLCWHATVLAHRVSRPVHYDCPARVMYVYHDGI